MAGGSRRLGATSRWCASPRLPGRWTGREEGLSTCPESLGCHQVPLILLPRRKGKKHVFPGPNPLHMGGHHREPAAHCRQAGHRPQEHCHHCAQDPPPGPAGRLLQKLLPSLPSFQSLHAIHLLPSSCPLPGILLHTYTKGKLRQCQLIRHLGGRSQTRSGLP